MDAHSAVFLDLQGTLGGDGLGDIRAFTFFPCAVPALRLLNASGLLAIVVTNQSHIGKGLFTYAEYEARAEALQRELELAGARWDAIYCCPHPSASVCACQKPKLGLLHEAQRAFGINLQRSYVVGDWGSVDMTMARAAGCKGILARTGVGESSLNEYRHAWADIEPDFIATDALQAAEWILKNRERRFERGRP